MDFLDILEEQTENVPDYEKTVLLVAALQLLMDQGLTLDDLPYHPIVQEMMELEHNITTCKRLWRIKND